MKNLHSSDSRDRTQAVQPIVKRLTAWDTWPYSEMKKLLDMGFMQNLSYLKISLVYKLNFYIEMYKRKFLKLSSRDADW